MARSNRSVDRLVAEAEAEFGRRKFAAGLLVALADMFSALGIPSLRASRFSDVTKRYPRLETISGGRRANTLILEISPGKAQSLRPFYDAVERFIRAEKKRFAYPTCAPHATQAWSDYETWLDALSTLSPSELLEVRSRVLDFVLQALPSQAFVPGSIKLEPPIFEALLQGFDLTARPSEPTGAAFQAVAFGFLRADNPHLQMEIAKVRTGSKRLQRVGDIDAWDGRRLAISAEVKQFVVRNENLADLKAFSNEVALRGAIGLVIALGVDEEARVALEGDGLHVLDRDDLLRIVGIWDPAKQAIAVSSVAYVFEHVEKNQSLTKRLAEFVKQVRD